MKNSNAAIVSQVHIPDFDVQGSLHGEHKRRLVELGLAHLRKYNPDSYIVMTGHGIPPSNLGLCDWHYWNCVSEPLDQNGLVIGQPAQFKYVHRGIEHVLEKGFRRCLKIRGDSLWGIPNFTDYCEHVILKERKRILLSQQTCHSSPRMGDCIMYGDTKLLDKIWHKDNPVTVNEGLQNTAANFLRACNTGPENWFALLTQTMAFRDVIALRWADLRWNGNELLKDPGLEEAVMSNKFDFRKYAWGKQWHEFLNESDMMTRYLPDLISQKEWYEQAALNSGR